MEHKFIEYFSKAKKVGLFLSVDEVLLSHKSAFQQVEFFRNDEFGVVLTLDGVIQITERDEFFYHEMLVHPAMGTHSNPESVLIIGGGDCGTLSQVIKHQAPKAITMVELDHVVVEGAIKHLPSLAASLDDPRVDLRFEDGFEFLASRTKEFDVLIVDCTDPETIANSLYTKNFYAAAANAIRKNGVFVAQSGIPFHPEYKDIQRSIHSNLLKHFPYVRFVNFPMPSYGGGIFSCVIGSHSDPEKVSVETIKSKVNGFKMRYYNPYIHAASMILPTEMKEWIEVKTSIGMPQN